MDLTWKQGKAVSATLRPSVSASWRIRAPQGQKIASIRSAKGPASLRPSGDGAIEAKLAGATAWRIQFA